MPLAGHDARLRLRTGLRLHFNPRAPCGARRLTIGQLHLHPPFQSTCPLRGTTKMEDEINDKTRYFNPRAPCGARRQYAHTSPRSKHFNPRAPCGARLLLSISPSVIKHFNPRAPCGARLVSVKFFVVPNIFQSTCPLRGTTLVVGHAIHAGIISIHVPLAGHDDVDFGAHVVRIHFNPRAPCGARPQPSSRPFSGRISIHVPLAGHDDLGHRHSGHIAISIHVPLAGHDGDYALFAGGNIISIHVPLAGHDDESQWQVLIDLISIHVPLAGHDDIYTLGRDAATGFQSTCPLRGTTHALISDVD